VSRPKVRAAILGGVAVTVAGGVGLAIGVTGSDDGALAPTPPPQMFITHLPPLLTTGDEKVSLDYQAVCPGTELVPADTCEAIGSVYVRAGQSGSFTATVPLTRTKAVDGTHWVAALPAAIATDPAGFSYYAEMRDPASGAAATLPAGGAAAAQRSLPMASAQVVRLPAHQFGQARAASKRVLYAPWGAEAGHAGISDLSEDAMHVGPSSFDVQADGTVVLLDQFNRRLQRWNSSGAFLNAVSVPIDPGTPDISVDDTGTVYLLDTNATQSAKPRLLRVSATGKLIDSTTIAEMAASRVTATPSGPIVDLPFSEQWALAYAGGSPAATSAQTRNAQTARTGRAGRAAVATRVGADEIRLAETVNQRVLRSWRIQSQTPVAEIQLAEPAGAGAVLVFKNYTETQDEFTVLVLSASGVKSSFNLPSASWAETAPLSRFRLRGNSLYQLGSDKGGAFVDRFDLEGMMP